MEFPEPSQCANQFCSNPGYVPATGMMGRPAECSSIQSMIRERNETGGLTGRGVTPCNFGFYQSLPFGPLQVTPAFTNLSEIFFEPSLAPWVPRSGNPRSLVRVGNTFRNAN